MHDLLRSWEPSRAEALAACRAYLARRWRRFGLAYALVPRDRRDDTLALAAWHELVREVVDEAPDEDTGREALDALSDIIERVFSGAPRTPVGVLLLEPARRYAWPSLGFRGPLEERRRAFLVRTFETRGELARHARKLCSSEGRLYLRAVTGPGEAQSEHSEALVDSLSTALVLVRWLVHLREDLDRGRIRIAFEDLARHQVSATMLERPRPDEAMRHIVAEQVSWIRSLFAKGWPLCDLLDRWTGRQLAFLLRWHAASLSAIEARRYDAFSGPPPAGWLRLTACATTSLVSRRPPEFAA